MRVTPPLAWQIAPPDEMKVEETLAVDAMRLELLALDELIIE